MKKQTTERGIFLSCALSQVVWLLSGVILILIFCTAAYSTADPDAITYPLSLCALYLSAIIGGIAAVRFSGDGIISGLISGVITALIVFMLSCLPLPETNMEFTKALILNLLVIPASVLGSIIGHKRKKVKSPMKRKHN